MSSDPGRMRRLLVVDDERIQRMIVSRAVEVLGYATQSAATLEEAAQCLNETRFDAIVLDLSLGEAEGISLLQSMRASSPEATIVFMSRLDDRVRTASMRLAAALGLRVAGALEKPVAPRALRELLSRAPMTCLQTDERLSEAPTADELADALDRDQVFVEFQPKIALATSRPIGVEALARWRPYGANYVSPSMFIPLAEHNGLIVRLTARVLQHALDACRRWRVRHPTCSVAVNVSPMILADPALPEEIDQALHLAQLGPGALVAEITESSVIANPLVAAEVLTRLRIKGVSLSIDDFGTGHSSLLTLLRLPFSELKIDRSFVTNCDSDPDAWKIVRATISMARELGLSVVAEGIETEVVANMLRDAGCHAGQGWFFGRSMPEEVLVKWLDCRAAMATS